MAFVFSFSAAKVTSRATSTSSKPSGTAKFWLDPIELAEARGFRGSELRELYSTIEEHRDKFIVAWDEHFGQ